MALGSLTVNCWDLMVLLLVWGFFFNRKIHGDTLVCGPVQRCPLWHACKLTTLSVFQAAREQVVLTLGGKRSLRALVGGSCPEVLLSVGFW